MPRQAGKNARRLQAEELAKRAAKAAAAAVLENADQDDDDDEDDEAEDQKESTMPGDDGRPKTLRGQNPPAAGGDADDAELGAEGPDYAKVKSVAEASEDEDDDDDDDDEEDDDEEDDKKKSKNESRNPLGRRGVREGAADDQLTHTDDTTRQDAAAKRRDPTHSGAIGNEITTKSHPAIAEEDKGDWEAGESPRGAAADNPGNPEDQLTAADNWTAADARAKGQRGPRGTGSPPSSGSLGADQDAEEAPLDPADLGFDQTVAEAVGALFNGEDLTEEFKTKASTILEAALKQIARKQAAKLTEVYDGYLDEKVSEIKEASKKQRVQIVERVDDYLGYVVEEWMKENKVAIENGVKNEICSDFMRGLHELFVAHHIDLPEDKVDAYTEATTKIADLEKQLGEQINSNVEIRKQLNTKSLGEVFDEAVDGLAETQKAKLSMLAEGLEFDTQKQYQEKLAILRKSYFPASGPAAAAEVVSEGGEEGDEPQVLNEKMSSYVKTAGRLGRSLPGKAQS